MRDSFHKVKIRCWILTFLSINFLCAGVAHAIPSPDLVINLSASAAQLLGLLSVVFGGVLVSNKGKLNKRKRNAVNKTSRKLLYFTLGLLILSLAVNLLQYTRQIDAKNTRLHTNLIRKSIENGREVGDTNLKTLSFSEQKTHPNGIETDDLAQYLAQGTELNIFDVRENAEVEGGMIEGAQHIRYPDLLANPDLIPNEGKNLLLCYSGNRSSELCNLLAQRGRDCNFVIGGYEKWMTEERPLSTDRENPSELRSLPDFPNKNTLLDTNVVLEMVNGEAAEFIDVRYPREYALNPLPKSHNITMRALTSVALDKRLDALPDVPLIAACYDKRSCFYSQLIGLSLVQRGKDYRGRYTVPHEFYQSSKDREHVQQWRAANERVTLISAISKPPSLLLQWFFSKTENYILAIALLVLIIRLMLLPLTIKAERDQAVQKSLLSDIEKIKKDYANHPRALSHATLELYRKHRIKPAFNLISALMQISLLLLFYSVVNNAADSWSQIIAWLDEPSAKDPLFILPVLAASLFAFLIYTQIKPKKRLSRILFVAGSIALLAILLPLNAAVNVYLCFSMLILIGQNAVIQLLNRHYNWDGSNAKNNVVPPDDGVIPLHNAHHYSGSGKKAARLGQLASSGYNVPDGFVLTDAITKTTKPDKGVCKITPSDTEIKKIEKYWSDLNLDKVAVRSSGVNEDGGNTSFAGVYDSILDVSKSELLAAANKVHKSLNSDRASSYQSGVKTDGEIDTERGGVLVQKMVPAEYAGVLFTEHPANAGAMLVELIAGLGEELVSGTVTPDAFAFGKYTDQALSEENPPIDLKPLISLGRELEELFGRPQDIEWAYADGEFFLLQSRDITRSVCDGDSVKNIGENERRRLLHLVKFAQPNNVCLEQNELSELLPQPTPASISFMQMMWSAGGSTDIACQNLGIPYDVNFKSNESVTTVFGNTFINKLEESYRLRKGPGALAAFKLARNADAIENRFREEVLPDLIEASAIYKAVDYKRLKLADLITTLTHRLEVFVKETYVEAELINIAADYYWKTATAKLSSAGIDPATYLNYAPISVASEAMRLLTQGQVGQEQIVRFLETSGHRALHDYELSTPRFDEDPNLVINLIQNSPKHKVVDAEKPELPNQKILRISVERVHRFQALKEDAKHYCLIELHEIRKILLAIDAHCRFNGNIFFLRMSEIQELDSTASIRKAKDIILQQQKKSKHWQAVLPPTQLSLKDLEAMNVESGIVAKSVPAGALMGKRVAGEGKVVGVARVIHSVKDIDQFKQGEILVARMTDPQWYSLFPKAAGIVTEVGGWLSHAAIVAREYNLPAIVGVTNACNAIQSGDLIELSSDGCVHEASDRRKVNSPMRQISEHGASHTPDSKLTGLRKLTSKRDRIAKQSLRNKVRQLNTKPPMRKVG